MIESFKIPSATFPTLTGSIVTFNSQYAGLPLKSHKIALTATQSGSGTPSPDNVRDIIGYSAIGISATGGNLWGGEAFYNPLVANGATLDTVEKTVSYSGAVARETGMVFDKFKPNTQYTLMLHVKSSNRNANMGIVYTDGTHRDILFGTETGDYQYLFTTPNTKSVSAITFYWLSGTAVIYYDEVCLLEGVHTIDDFEPFGTYKYIDLGDTYYGLNYDGRSGIGTVTYKIVDLGLLSWSRQTGLRPDEYLFRAQITDIKTPIDTSKMLCEILNCVGTDRNALYDVDYGLAPWNNTNNYVTIRISTITNTTDLLNVIDGYKLMYELATPQTIQLPPCPIDTLEGVNNVFADTGETTLQYLKFG